MLSKPIVQTFSCCGLNFCVNFSSSVSFDYSGLDCDGFAPLATFDYKTLNLSLSLEPSCCVSSYCYASDSAMPLLIFSNELTKHLYLENKHSDWMTYSPTSVSVFSCDANSVFLAIKNTMGESYFKNSIIRFFINHLVAAGGLFFHASGAVIDNKAFIMTGFSDAGKSTALELLDLGTILSDDMIGSRCIDGKQYFYSTPFGRKVTENVQAEAKVVFFLVQSDKMRVEKLTKMQAVARYLVIHQRYIISVFKPLRRLIFKQAREFFHSVRAYELHFAKDHIDKDAIFRIMNGDETGVGQRPMADLEWQINTMTKIKRAKNLY